MYTYKLYMYINEIYRRLFTKMFKNVVLNKKINKKKMKMLTPVLQL